MFNYFRQFGRNDESSNVAGLSSQETSDEEDGFKESSASELRRQQVRMADMIDAQFVEQRQQRAEQSLMNNPKRKINFNVGIKPGDQEWVMFQDRLKTAFLKDFSLKEIMNIYFEEGQQLEFIPPMQPGVILDCQAKNASEYHNLLENDLRFQGLPDNLLTKLTFLHFGLPVAALTLKNLRQRLDSSYGLDTADDDEELPTAQEVLSTERQLDFLDVYNERSYGYKISRVGKPAVKPTQEKFTISESGIDESMTVQYTGQSRHTSRPRGGMTQQGPGHMRDLSEFGYIYNLHGGRLLVGDDVASFTQQSLKLLGIDESSDWSFRVQQYKHRPKKGQGLLCYIMNTSGAFSTTVSKDDTSAWDNYIKFRALDRSQPWAMIIHTEDHVPSVVSVAEVDGLGNTKEAISIDQYGRTENDYSGQCSDDESACKSDATSRCKFIFYVEGKAFEVGPTSQSLRDYDLWTAILEQLNLTSVSRYRIMIDIYRTSTLDSTMGYVSSEELGHKSPDYALEHLLARLERLELEHVFLNIRRAENERDEDWLPFWKHRGTETAKRTVHSECRLQSLNLDQGSHIRGDARFSRDRVDLSDAIGRRVPPSYIEWMAEQHRLDNVQRSTFNQLQPIFQAGRLPSDPEFGEREELAILVSDQLPTVHSRSFTLTDFKKLQAENRRLRNQILERELGCQMCETSFEGYESQKRKEHIDTHVRALQSAGLCVFCGDKAWQVMSAQEKRNHLLAHQQESETQLVKDFWAGFICPGCDEDLSELKSKNSVLDHVLAHNPLTARFCDRCSRSLQNLTLRESRHHQTTCFNAPSKFFGDDDWIYCDKCQFNMVTATEVELERHENCCQFIGSSYCATCGWETSTMSQENLSTHHENCKPPGGEPNTFCKHCGELQEASVHGNCKSEQFIGTSIYQRAIDKEESLKKSQQALEKDRHALELDRGELYRQIDAFSAGQIQSPISHRQKESYSLQNDANQYKMIRCPLKRSDGYYSGDVLSSNPDSQVFKTHYMHRNEIGSKTALAPNTAEFRRRRAQMEEASRNLNEIARREERKYYDNAQAGIKVANDLDVDVRRTEVSGRVRGIATTVEEPVDTPKTCQRYRLPAKETDERSSELPDSSPLATKSATKRPPPTSGDESSVKRAKTTRNWTPTTSSGESDVENADEKVFNSSNQKAKSQYGHKANVDNNYTYDSDTEATTEIDESTPINKAKAVSTATAAKHGISIKRGAARKFKGANILDPSFHLNRTSTEGDYIEDEPDSAKVAAEIPLLLNHGLPISPPKRPSPGKGGNGVRVARKHVGSILPNNITFPTSIEQNPTSSATANGKAESNSPKVAFRRSVFTSSSKQVTTTEYSPKTLIHQVHSSLSSPKIQKARLRHKSKSAGTEAPPTTPAFPASNDRTGAYASTSRKASLSALVQSHNSAGSNPQTTTKGDEDTSTGTEMSDSARKPTPVVRSTTNTATNPTTSTKDGPAIVISSGTSGGDEDNSDDDDGDDERPKNNDTNEKETKRKEIPPKAVLPTNRVKRATSKSASGASSVVGSEGSRIGKMSAVRGGRKRRGRK